MYRLEDMGGAAPAVVAPAGPTPNYGVQGFSPGAKTGGGRAPIPIRRTAPAKTAQRYVPKPASSRLPSSSKVGSGPTGNIAPITQPAPPAAPSVDDWLAGDSTFQSQNNALAKAWADYQNNAKMQTDQYNNQYGQNVDAMNKQKDLDAHSLEDDYASRGLLTSGLYAKANTDFLTSYADKQKTLDTGKADFLANLLAAQQGFQSDQGIQTDKARQDAINRRAAQYGV